MLLLVCGSTDEHRALNYLAVRYPTPYSKTVEMFGNDFSLASIEVHPSHLSGPRKIVDVIFSTASLNMLNGQAPNFRNAKLEIVPQLSNHVTICLYHLDIPLQNVTVTDIAIQIHTDSDTVLPSASTVIIDVSEIMPGAGRQEEEY
jgi:hypothetical protein